jgi:predicted RNA-binding Zn-ribbon protein involved in translation (DUF1610 family)
MDPSDRLREALDGVACTACGASVPPDRIRVLAEREDLRVVERGCPACGSTEIDLATHAAPINQTDVDEMRTLLAGWRGDIHRLLDAR